MVDLVLNEVQQHIARALAHHTVATFERDLRIELRAVEARAVREESSVGLALRRPHGFEAVEEALVVPDPGAASAAFERVETQVRLSRYGYDCYAYCMLAAGHIDLVIEASLQPYDIVALVPIIEGAGGIVTTWDGGSPAKGGAIVAAGDRRIHAEAIAKLNG